MKPLLLWLALFMPLCAWAQGSDLLSKLTRDHVDISVRYVGDQITLMGAMSAPGHIVVKVRSPAQPLALEKKGQVGPFWLSQGKRDLKDTPGLYYLLSSAPIDSLLPASTRAEYGLSLAAALKDMRVVDPGGAAVPAPAEAKAAVLRLQQAQHDYVIDSKAVDVLGGRLFSTTIHLPAQLPFGKYTVDVYLVRNGRIVDIRHHTIMVRQVRAEQWISNVANNHPWPFGLVFTAGMMLLGLLLGVVLGRGKKS